MGDLPRPLPLPRPSRFLLLAVLGSAILPAGLLLPDETAAVEKGQAGLAREIVARLDEMPLNSLWDSVARLEGLGKDAVPAIRKAASGGAGEKGILGASRALLTLGDEAVRQEALKGIAALARSGRDREVRAAAIELLGREDPEGSTELLRQVFEEGSSDPEILIPAAKMLWEVEQDAPARKKLVDLLRSRDRKVRAAAALALAEVHCFDGDVREVLRELRQEPSARGRLAETLLRVDTMARQEERDLDSGAALPGVDTGKLLKERTTKIRELEARVEGISRSRGVGVEDPVLREVIEKIQKNYIEPSRTNPRELILNAVKGMVHSLDDYSSFFDVQETDRFLKEMKGEYYGIGLQVSKLTEDGPLEVMKPIYGGVAYRAGLRTGDRILEVDGVSTEEFSQEEIVEKHLKGPEGTVVTLKVFRRGWPEPREFKIPRQVIEVPSVYAEMLPGKLGYLRLINFGEKSVEEFVSALDQLQDDGMEALLFDLRYNPGGFLSAAVAIVDLFVGESADPIVTQQGRGEPVSTMATAGERPNYPMVILVNGRSASASEVVAGALKDFHRATLVGQRTFGKGSVQNLFPMSPQARDLLGGETRLRLTVQYYYLPRGRCIHTERDEYGRPIPGKEGGVEPDHVVEPESYPPWVSEEVEKIRTHPKVVEYVDRQFEELKPLGLNGDERQTSRWTGFDDLYRELQTPASQDQVRQVLRYHLRRRLEDERGKEFPSDFQEDVQLQRAIQEALQKLGKKLEDLPEYAWLAKSRK